MMETTSAPPKEHVVQSIPEMQNYDLASELERMFPENERFPSWIWDLIFGIIKWAAIIGISLALIIFFFKPFFSSHFKSFWKEGRLWKFFMFICITAKQLLSSAARISDRSFIKRYLLGSPVSWSEVKSL